MSWHCKERRLGFLDDQWAGNKGIREGHESAADRWQVRKVSTMQRRVHGGLRWEDGEMVNDDGKRTPLSKLMRSIQAGSHD